MKKYLPAIIVIVFSLVGFFVAYDALQVHYAKGESGLCSAVEGFDCDLVNQSVYSQFFGIPFALIGMIGYIALILLTGAILLRKAHEEQEMLFTALCAMATIGLGIQLYLTFIEAFVLRSWCLLCLISQAAILIVTITAWIWRHYSLKQA